ncbi:MAG: ABC transporter ATP-binding protein [Prevotella sp.]|nr:ABC transporter ATP-binding protein/permease [Prevotella sp.]MDD7606108.1 ABC transporter ATP-binding protein [Prevotellaceae bacterium]MDY3248709.1 ABC transporter ATP-binding protein [Prevotella sp.]
MQLLHWRPSSSSSYSSMQILRWLWSAWRGNRLQAVLNALIGVLMVAVSLAQVWAVKRAIDVAAGSAGGSLLWAVAVMGLLILTDFGLNISSVWVRNILGIRAQNRMQQRMLDRLLRAEWAGRERRHSGDVINRLETDVNNVVTFLTETLPNTLGVLLLFIGAFSYLFSMDRLLAFVTVAILPLFIGVSKLYVRRMRSLTRMVRNSDSQVQSVLQEAIQHRLLIKTLEDDDAMVGKLAHTQQQLRYHVLQRTRFSVLSNFILNFGFSFSYLVAFLWAAVRMSQHTLTFGGMTAFLQLVNRIQTPARSLSKVIPAFVNVFTAAERLMELEEAPLEEQGEPIAFDAPCGVRFTDVTYAYEADAPVIDRLTFDFRPGTCTAILGETGAGKTTLIRLILALIRPQQGQVELYDSRHALPLSPRMRCNFVYVPQGNTLMSGTIRDNLLLGRRDASDEEMLQALHQACADFVSELPAGLDTPCSEAGGGLSEGQAQRITIARALLRNRPVMLFDESTSALDPATEQQLLANLLDTRHRTIIFITHRPAVVKYCDRVLRLDRR